MSATVNTAIRRTILAECDRAISNNRLEEVRIALRAQDAERAVRLQRGIAERRATDDFADWVRAYASGRLLSRDGLDTVLEWFVPCAEIAHAACALTAGVQSASLSCSPNRARRAGPSPQRRGQRQTGRR
jgi:hypothetical protein